MENQIVDQVANVIRKVVKQPRLEVTAETEAGHVDGWDSLHHMMIIVDVEKVFDIKFDFMEILEMKSVGDICKAVENNK